VLLLDKIVLLGRKSNSRLDGEGRLSRGKDNSHHVRGQGRTKGGSQKTMSSSGFKGEKTNCSGQGEEETNQQKSWNALAKTLIRLGREFGHRN